VSDRHPILTQHPEWVALDDREAKLRDAQDHWREARNEEKRLYLEAKERYKHDRDEAIVNGQLAPEPPEDLPDHTEEAHQFLMKLNRIATEREKLLAKLQLDIEAAALEREETLLDQARELVDQLHPLAEELSSLASTLRSAQVAARVDTRTRASVRVHDLVEAVTRRDTLLMPEKRTVRIQ
jgi:hypothetical protein